MSPDQPPVAVPGPACAACPDLAVVQWLRRADAPDATQPVFACAAHAITLDAAARIHRPTCPAPDPALLPECGCDPEPLPPAEPLIPETAPISTGWVLPTA